MLRSKVFRMLLALTCLAMLASCAASETTPPDADEPTPEPDEQDDDSPSQPTQETIVWQGQDNNASESLWYAFTEETCAAITAASGGRLEMKPFPGGAIVPANKEFDGVDTGAINFAHNTPSFWLDKFPTAGLFSYQVAGLSPVEMLGWMRGDGGELMQEMVSGTNVYLPMGSGIIGTAETFLHSSVPIEEPSDLNGLKIRGAGDAAEVLGRLGASMVFIPGTEIYESMQRGVIDAFELSNPTVDWSYSAQEIGEYKYLGPIRQPCENGTFMVNRDDWEALPDDLKTLVLEVMRGEPLNSLYTLMEQDAEHVQMMIDYGNEVSFVPESVEEAMQEEAADFYMEKAEGDAFFAKVYASATAYRDQLRTAFPRY